MRRAPVPDARAFSHDFRGAPTVPPCARSFSRFVIFMAKVLALVLMYIYIRTNAS